MQSRALFLGLMFVVACGPSFSPVVPENLVPPEAEGGGEPSDPSDGGVEEEDGGALEPPSDGGVGPTDGGVESPAALDAGTPVDPAADAGTAGVCPSVQFPYAVTTTEAEWIRRAPAQFKMTQGARRTDCRGVVAQFVASAPVGLATEDVDGDGDIDVAVGAIGHGPQGENVGAGHAGSYTVLLNDGQGALVAEHAWEERGATPLERWSEGGRPALLLGSNGAASLSSVRLVDGAVQRTAVLKIQLPMYVASFGLADIDRDGLIEHWAYGHDFEGSSYFVSEAFSWSGEQESYAGLRSTTVRAADVDGDGIAELVTDGAFGTGAMVLSREHGATVLKPLGLGPALAFSDLDADGLPDAIHRTVREGPASVSFRRADGTYGSAISLPGSEGVRTVKAEDLDRDGDGDVLWLAKGQLLISLQHAPGVFGAPKIHPARNLSDFEVVDLDRDGTLEILAVDFSDGTLLTIPSRVLLLAPQACEVPAVACEIGPPRSFPVDVASNGWLHAADVDGDAVPEIYAADGSRVVVKYTPSLQGIEVRSIRVDLPVERIFSADIEGTGLDVLFGYVRPGDACGSAAGLARFEPDASGSHWTAQVLYEEHNVTDPRRDPFVAEAADLDGDGSEELVVRGDQWFSETAMAIYRFGEGGTVTRIATSGRSPCGYEGFPHNAGPTGILHQMRAADVDGDGRNDLLFRGMNVLGLQDPDGTFRMQCNRFRGGPIEESVPTIADVTGDGVPDALFWSTGGYWDGPRTGYLAEGRGGGEFADPKGIPARLDNAFASQLHPGGAAVIVSGSTPGGVFTTHLASGGPAGLGPQSSIPGGELLRVLGDIDGDANKELILVDRTSISFAAVRCGEAR